MNWISNYVRPTINSLFSRREVPDNLWTKCKECGTMLFHRELSENLNVCTSCDHHMAMQPRARFNALFDGGIFTEIEVPAPVPDPLHFRDQKKYPDRMRSAQKSTGEKEAMLVAHGEIGRTKIVAAAQDFSFMGGSMGMYVGNAIIAAAQFAVKHKRPLVLFSAAGGARMQEGILSLMQMPRTTVAVQMLKEANFALYRRVDPPNNRGRYGVICDVGRRPYRRTKRAYLLCWGRGLFNRPSVKKLPAEFQRSEYLLDHGMLDRVTHRRQMRDELITITRILLGQSAAVKGDLPAPAKAEPESTPAVEAAPTPTTTAAKNKPGNKK